MIKIQANEHPYTYIYFICAKDKNNAENFGHKKSERFIADKYHGTFAVVFMNVQGHPNAKNAQHNSRLSSRTSWPRHVPSVQMHSKCLPSIPKVFQAFQMCSKSTQHVSRVFLSSQMCSKCILSVCVYVCVCLVSVSTCLSLCLHGCLCICASSLFALLPVYLSALCVPAWLPAQLSLYLSPVCLFVWLNSCKMHLECLECICNASGSPDAFQALPVF